jgi:hypothetical protein
MTKKDYVLLADILASVQNQYLKGRLNADDVIPTVAKAFCEDARLDNPRFDEKRFLTACCIEVA